MTTTAVAEGEQFVLLSAPEEEKPTRIEAPNVGGEAGLSKARGTAVDTWTDCLDGFLRKNLLPVTGSMISTHPPVVCPFRVRLSCRTQDHVCHGAASDQVRR